MIGHGGGVGGGGGGGEGCVFDQKFTACKRIESDGLTSTDGNGFRL